MQEITRPDDILMIGEECFPILARWKFCPHLPDVSLDGALAEMDIQLEQLAADTLRAPGQVLNSHLSEQCNRARRDPGIRLLLGLPSPDQPQQVTMPAQQGIRLDDMNGRFPGFSKAGKKV